MAKFIAAAKKFVREEEGATMVEYAIMVALIAVVSLVVVTTLGTTVRDTFSNVNAQLEAAKVTSVK